MKKTLTIKTDIIYAVISLDGTTVTIEQINPVMNFGNKHYVLHMEKMNVAGDTFLFDNKKSFEILCCDEEKAILAMTEMIYKERGNLFVYAIKDEYGNYTSDHQIRIFKAIGSPVEEYSINYTGRSFVINKTYDALEEIKTKGGHVQDQLIRKKRLPERPRECFRWKCCKPDSRCTGSEEQL